VVNNPGYENRKSNALVLQAPGDIRQRMKTLSLLCAVLVSLASVITAHAADARKPNVIFILADDLGYGELGCYGQKKIRTPSLDRLAAGGMRFTQHYSGNAVCAPSRCVLMTGKHPGHAYIRDNREVQPEGQTPIPANTITLAKLLKQQGFATAAMGKWGLGPVGSEGDPLKQGFDRFYGYNCQRHAHNYYPTYLYDNDKRVELKNPRITIGQKLPPNADPNAPASYEAFKGKDYAPDLTAEQALRFIRENKDRPFFLYYATTVPHLALQVPDDALAEYAGQWPDPPYVGGKGYLPNRTPRATYAAMITRMDSVVGRMAALVDELGLENDTIFIFTSDNGPVLDGPGGSDAKFFESAGPFRGMKGSLYEGGIREPCIVRWKGHVQAGGTSERVTGFEDWLPTILDLCGELPTRPPPDVDGISFAPALRGQAQAPRPFLYREFPAYGGQQAVRLGDWKGIRQKMLPAKGGQLHMQIELYNLKDDISEKKDVAAEYPDVASSIERLMREQHTPSPLFKFPALDEPPAK
jgi:arylsulfatase A-like enzyme